MMPERSDRALELLDSALLRTRRLWTSSVFTDRLRSAIPAEVDLSAVFVVEAVGRAAGAHETTIGRLAELLGVEASTASRLAAGAQAAGLVRRGPSTSDGRRIALTLTRTGEELHDTALHFRLELLRDLTAGWTHADREAFSALLTRFATAVTEARAEDVTRTEDSG